MLSMGSMSVDWAAVRKAERSTETEMLIGCFRDERRIEHQLHDKTD